MNKLVSIIVVLGLPKTKSIAPLIVRAQTIVDALDADKTMFPSPTPAHAVSLAHIATLASTETAFKNRLGTLAARDDARAVVVADMHQLHNYVQSVVNANPAQAEVIATSASMSIRTRGALHKKDLTVKQMVSGSVHVVAKAVKGAKAHDWQFSTDGGKTWLDAPSTTTSSTIMAGLQPATTVSFRQRVLTTAGRSDWSAVVTAVVA